MVTEGIYMAVVSAVDEEVFIDQCGNLLSRGWQFHGTVIKDGYRWSQWFMLTAELKDERNTNP